MACIVPDERFEPLKMTKQIRRRPDASLLLYPVINQRTLSPTVMASTFFSTKKPIFSVAIHWAGVLVCHHILPLCIASTHLGPRLHYPMVDKNICHLIKCGNIFLKADKFDP